MDQLSKLKCQACDASAKLLSQDEIESLLSQVQGWEIIVDSGIKKLKCDFATKNYVKSVAFTNVIAEMAETINHHPQIILEYASVTVIWWSHNIKGLHKNDFIMAAKTSELF
ncbi:MAG: 4a-hydroxytetrahydrobiopterin dehydratase [Alteromonadaceae bacterium]|nr:4a-hydroxytetrahydrobiopterin dehydratase [Alteromonadaceae bacterium]